MSFSPLTHFSLHIRSSSFPVSVHKLLMLFLILTCPFLLVAGFGCPKEVSSTLGKVNIFVLIVRNFLFL